MILKLWNEIGNCWVFWDNVKKIQVENDWAFIKSDRFDELTKSFDSDGPYHLYRDENGKLKMNTSVFHQYDADYRGKDIKRLINESAEQDSYYRVRIIDVVFRNNNAESFILNGSGIYDCYLMNDDGKTIDKL